MARLHHLRYLRFVQRAAAPTRCPGLSILFRWRIRGPISDSLLGRVGDLYRKRLCRDDWVIACCGLSFSDAQARDSAFLVGYRAFGTRAGIWRPPAVQSEPPSFQDTGI